MSVLSDLLFNNSAEIAGTPRVQEVVTQDVESVGGSIQSVITAMLNAGEDAAIKAIAGTPEGQAVAQKYALASAQNYMTAYGPVAILVIGVVLLFVLGGRMRR